MTTTCDEIRDRVAAGAEDASVAAHLAACTTCREEAAALRRAATTLRAALVLESSRARRAPFFADDAPAPRRFSRLAAAALLLVAALGAGAWLVLRDTAPRLDWTGDGRAVRLSAASARLDAGTLRFVARGAFTVATRVATFAGDGPAEFRLALEKEVDPMNARQRTGAALVAAAGGGVLAAILFVDSGEVGVAGEAAGTAPDRVVVAGETLRVEAPEMPTRTAAPRPVEPPPAAASDPPVAAAEPEDETPRGSCHGRLVFDDDGSPVARETVWLWGTPHVVSRTDRDGRFLIERDWVGEMPRGLVVGPENAGVIVGEVKLVANERVDATFVVPRGFELEVTTVDAATGAPVDAVFVALDPVPRGDVGTCVGHTDSLGRVAFRRVARRPHGLRAYKEGWLASSPSFDYATAGARESLRVEMTEAQPFTLVIENWPDGREENVDVGFMRVGDPELGRSGRIGTDGVFRSNAPTPGSYAVVEIIATGWRHALGPVDVPAGEPLELRTRLPDGASVTGRVVASDGVGVGPGVMTITSNPDANRGPATRTAKLDASGRFAFEMVPPGRYDVTIQLQNGGWLSNVQPLDVPSQGLADHVITLASGRISGRLTGRSPDGIGLSAALAERPFEGPSHHVEVGADGRFEFHHLAAGRWRIVSDPAGDGYTPPSDVDVAEGAAARVKLTWKRYPEATFVLRGADGRPSGRSVPVNAYGEEFGMAPLLHLEPDASGNCTLRRLPPGHWRLVVLGTGTQIGQFEIPENVDSCGPFELVIPD